MTSLKRKARLTVNPIELKAADKQGVSLVDSILELSNVTMGYLGGDVHADKIHNLDLSVNTT